MADRLMVSVSGVRGTVGGTLTGEVARQFGSAFATMLGAGSTVTIARDTRPSGPDIQRAVTDGLLAGGVSVIDLGVVSTPGAALMTGRLKAEGGVVITASHNPGRYNGIKFLQPTGPALRAADAGRLADIWRAGEFAAVEEDERGALSTNSDTHGEHVEAVCAVVDEPGIASRRFKVVVDSINGAGCVVTPMLLSRLGCELVHVNGQPTGEFAHEPEPIAANLTDLGQAVRRHAADVGFAQDPDADRLVIFDEAGRFIGEECTLALAVAHALRHRKGKVATNLATSRMIDDIAAAAGCEVVRSPIGEANVVEAMLANDCILGGEGNGGVIDPRVVCVRDSLVAIAMTLNYMADTGRTVSRLAAELPKYVMAKTKMPCPADAADAVAAAARKAFAGAPGAKFNDADGLRIDLPAGWVSVRASNTEPIMRVTAEAREHDQAISLLHQVGEIAESVIAALG